MNRLLALLSPTAFAAGLLAIAWAGSSALRHHPLAAVMTALIAAFFLLGAWELARFRRASSGLQQALSVLKDRPAELGPWLSTLPESLREPVRQRLEGARFALPAPVLAPALAGLLVLLGMLGTFTGLVLTLGGTASAMGSSTDLATLRNALSTPVQGLGLAFGSSVAGVAASAALGLMSALARRERALVAQQLEQALAGPLHAHTAAQRSAEAREAQLALPALVGQVQQLAQQLAAQQAEFHAAAQARSEALAQTIEENLQRSLRDSANHQAAALQSASESAFAGIARESGTLLARLTQRFESGAAQMVEHQALSLGAQSQASAVQAQRLTELLSEFSLQARQQQQQLAERFESGAAALVAQQQAALVAQAQAAAEQLEQARTQLAEAGAQTLAQQQQLSARFETTLQAQTKAAATQAESASAALQQAGSQLLAQWQAAQQAQQQTQAAAEAERLGHWRSELSAIASALHERWAEAGAQAAAQQQQLAAQLAASSQGVVAEARALLDQASQAPRAAAELVASLREQLSASLARDNAALAERAELLQTLAALLSTVQQAAGEQRGAIDALVTQAATLLEKSEARFAEQAGNATAQLGEAATLLAASSAEMGALGEGFGAAVAQFHSSSEQLAAQLQGLDAQLERGATRSDEQMRYYVAQARELIELCLHGQKQTLDALKALPA